MQDDLVRPKMLVMNARSTIKDQIQRVREEAVVAAVNRLLATKGYDAMTVDDLVRWLEVAREQIERTG